MWVSTKNELGPLNHKNRKSQHWEWNQTPMSSYELWGHSLEVSCRDTGQTVLPSFPTHHLQLSVPLPDCSESPDGVLEQMHVQLRWHPGWLSAPVVLPEDNKTTCRPIHIFKSTKHVQKDSHQMQVCIQNYLSNADTETGRRIYHNLCRGNIFNYWIVGDNVLGESNIKHGGLIMPTSSCWCTTRGPRIFISIFYQDRKKILQLLRRDIRQVEMYAYTPWWTKAVMVNVDQALSLILPRSAEASVVRILLDNLVHATEIYKNGNKLSISVEIYIKTDYFIYNLNSYQIRNPTEIQKIIML